MKKLNFVDTASLSNYIYELTASGIDVTTILFYDDIKELLREIMFYDDVEPFIIDLYPPEWDGYEGEYSLTISPCDMRLFVERCCVNGRYLDYESKIVLIDAAASKDAVTKIDDPVVCEISILHEPMHCPHCGCTGSICIEEIE